MYKQLIHEISQLPVAIRENMTDIYHAFAQGKQVDVQHYQYCVEQSRACYVHHNQRQITACFGCDSQEQDHRMVWQIGSAYAWCIWDAFFVCASVGLPATIYSTDVINDAPIKIEYQNGQFNAPKLWFTFPEGNHGSQCNIDEHTSLRACFCCRTRAFVSKNNAEQFAAENQCEVVDMAQMIARTDEMVRALTAEYA